MLHSISLLATESWHILALSAPYMLLGFSGAALLKAFIPDNFIARHLGSHSSSSLVKAALFGAPIPLCSCGVLPAAAGIRKQGASKGATTAFLISTPETGVDSIAVTWALLDPVMAILRPLSAIITALITGQLVRVFDPEPDSLASTINTSTSSGAEECCHCQNSGAAKDQPSSSIQRLRTGISFAFGDLFADIAGWFFIGIVLSGVISLYVSTAWMDAWLGNPLIAMVAMLLIATPLYVCATASTPIAAALILKGLNPGAALVFLLAGPATNAAAITVISRILGKRATLLYLGGIILCSFVLGIGVDAIYAHSTMATSWHISAAPPHDSWFGSVCAIVLIMLFIYTRLKRGKNCPNH
ncbi:MAG: SO_0444 family Cu/Zn efflux transporter [Desulfuromonas sp.]|nr:SO_0444 family Cu/Zn efflux transporter [Desulfuromonas sp.]